jgi:hypothetical protein
MTSKAPVISLRRPRASEEASGRPYVRWSVLCRPKWALGMPGSSPRPSSFPRDEAI